MPFSRNCQDILNPNAHVRRLLEIAADGGRS